ncbi:transcriptional regulator, TetR family [Tessaracoccus bendigoensis DSM 12906]|uniref:Transcriptional regulator, TetR family n=1 Tax=Tessaracoccus bendigoensis DSM 12906 TaxID=1123357 RepID=A0A1M6LAX0_9ACTN|nr:TetR/AcrR family transcriptional regulator [Tessaracoccus bendigoensis]SHJ68279.1 transcriptional regulator, TetR family [Tessaracoccus bendigoensis DSM 12906]
MEVKPRRDRNMDAKRARILAAASRLFGGGGYAAVTTQAVSDAADVAAGTLFRYARTKADLLLMVYNEEFGTAIEEGRRVAARVANPAEAAYALIAPVLEFNARQPENAIAYQRELLFGHGVMLHREEGLRLVAGLEESIATVLMQSAQVAEASSAEAHRAARLIFGGLHLALAEPSTHAHPDKSTPEELRAQVALVVRGFLDTVNTAPVHITGTETQGDKNS